MNGNISADTFKASSSESYLCSKDQTVDLGNGLKMSTKDMQFQAFMTNPDFNNFSGELTCTSLIVRSLYESRFYLWFKTYF